MGCVIVCPVLVEGVISHCPVWHGLLSRSWVLYRLKPSPEIFSSRWVQHSLRFLISVNDFRRFFLTRAREVSAQGIFSTLAAN